MDCAACRGLAVTPPRGGERVGHDASGLRCIVRSLGVVTRCC